MYRRNVSDDMAKSVYNPPPGYRGSRFVREDDEITVLPDEDYTLSVGGIPRVREKTSAGIDEIGEAADEAEIKVPLPEKAEQGTETEQEEPVHETKPDEKRSDEKKKPLSFDFLRGDSLSDELLLGLVIFMLATGGGENELILMLAILLGIG